MIFLIKEEVLQEAEKYKDSIEYLLDSFYRGKHIIDFENSILLEDNLIPLFEENTNIRKAIEYYKVQRQNISALRTQVQQYVEVGLDEYGISLENESRVVKINISYFDRELEQCWLLSENLSDCEFYLSMVYNAKHFGHYPELFKDEVRLSFEIDNGSGYGTSESLERRINSKKVVLCIVDSDKKNKDDKISGTSGQVLSTWQQLKESPTVSDLYILNVREKENLIPPSLYLEYSEFSSKKKDTLSHLKSFEKTEKAEYLAFVKLSDKNKSMRYDKNSEVKDELLLTNSMKSIGKKALTQFAKNRLYTKEFSLLIDVTYVVQDENLIDLFKEIPDYLVADYNNLIKKIYTFTCSLSKVRI